VTYTDAMVGKVLNELEMSGFANNTIIVFMGDHGEKFATTVFALNNFGLLVKAVVSDLGHVKTSVALTCPFS